MLTRDLIAIHEEINKSESTSVRNHAETLGMSNEYLTSIFQKDSDYVEKRIKSYLLGTKFNNKLKHVDPTKKIVDAADIDWSDFNVSFNSTRITASSTYEIFTIIFALLAQIYNGITNTEFVWNDSGNFRTSLVLWNSDHTNEMLRWNIGSNETI